MHLLRTDFMLYENWSALRHVAPFVRQETGTREIDLYQLIRSRTTEQPQEWPSLHAMVAFGAYLMAPPHSWALVLDDLRRFVISELGVETIRVDDDDKLPRYVAGVLARLQEVWVGRQIAEVKSKLQRMSPVDQGDEYHALFGDLVAMEAYRRSLLEQASGDDLTA